MRIVVLVIAAFSCSEPSVEQFNYVEHEPDSVSDASTNVVVSSRQPKKMPGRVFGFDADGNADSSKSWRSGWYPRVSDADPFGLVGPGSTKYWGQGRGSDGRINHNPTTELCFDRGQLGLEEESFVHAGALTHNDPSPFRDWQIRLGKGSQIYSIITSYGEGIGAQQSDSGSVFNDAVLQYTARSTHFDVSQYPDSERDEIWISRPPNEETLGEVFRVRRDDRECDVFYNRNNDIHQAGTYAMFPLDGGLKAYPYYSPMLEGPKAYTNRFGENAVKTIVWPQPSHTPTSYRSHLTLEQHITDKGSGIVQIRLQVHNSGRDVIETMKLWSSFNRRLFDINAASGAPGTKGMILTSDAEGSPHVICLGGARSDSGISDCEDFYKNLANPNFGGWTAMARSIDPAADPYRLRSNPNDRNLSRFWGMAIVIGKNPGDPSYSETHIEMRHRIGPNIGYSARSVGANLGPGQTWNQTYYLVFDRMDRLAKTARKLVQGTMGNRFSIPSYGVQEQLDHDAPIPFYGVQEQLDHDAPLGMICQDRDSDEFSLYRCSSNSSVARGALYRTPVENTVPVFAIYSDEEGWFYTSDPYARGYPSFTSERTYENVNWVHVHDDRRVQDWFRAREEGTRIGISSVTRFPRPTDPPTAHFHDRTIYAPDRPGIPQVKRLLGYGYSSPTQVPAGVNVRALHRLPGTSIRIKELHRALEFWMVLP